MTDKTLTTWEDYVIWTQETARYPESGLGTPAALNYAVLELATESVELSLAGTSPAAILDETGDVAWALARCFIESKTSRRLPWVRDGQFPSLYWANRAVGKVKTAQRRGALAASLQEPAWCSHFASLLTATFAGMEALVRVHGLTMEDVCGQNKLKLLDRLAQGTLNERPPT
mgnify:CR=1 FL=1